VWLAVKRIITQLLINYKYSSTCCFIINGQEKIIIKKKNSFFRYEAFMKTFGKSNSMQSSSQTGDDNLEVSANLQVKGTVSREGFGLCWYAWMNLGLDS
jgi:hypothetical protein